MKSTMFKRGALVKFWQEHPDEPMSTTTNELSEKAYRQLRGQTLPHVIRTEEEYQRLTNELAGLDDRENPSPGRKRTCRTVDLVN